MWEEVASGGAIGLVGTLLGIWVAHVLQQRSIEAEKVERAAKLRELLAGEIMTNTGQILTGPEIDKLTDTNELPRSRNQPYLARTVFEMGRSDLSLLPSELVSKVLMCYHNFDVYDQVVEKCRGVEQNNPTKLKFEALVWTLRAIRQSVGV